MKRISSERLWNRAKLAVILTLTVAAAACVFCACGTESTVDTSTTVSRSSESEKPVTEKELTLTINGQSVSVQWEDNESVEALKNLVKDNPLSIQMSMYGGFEQVGSLGTTLPRNDSQTAAAAGDIVLYSGNQIVIFYGSNSWAYTRLGRIAGKSTSEMSELLGNGNVTIAISTA